MYTFKRIYFKKYDFYIYFILKTFLRQPQNYLNNFKTYPIVYLNLSEYYQCILSEYEYNHLY